MIPWNLLSGTIYLASMLKVVNKRFTVVLFHYLEAVIGFVLSSETAQ